LENYFWQCPIIYLPNADNCTGEAFGELFLAMTDNLSSKC